MTESIVADLEPMFEQAKREGLWFFHNSMCVGPLWFSPKELRKAHAAGKFLWGAVNWKLRPPQEMIEAAIRDVNDAQAKLSQLHQRIAEAP